MREMIEEVVNLTAVLFEIDNSDHSSSISRETRDALDGAGFGFLYNGGARTFSIGLDTPRDLRKFGAELLFGNFGLLGAYAADSPFGYGGHIFAYWWASTMEPVFIVIRRGHISIKVDRDHPDYPVYSFLADLRRYVDPDARLEKI